MKADELQRKGYHAFSWGDFWRTGMTATAARRQQTGYRRDGSHGRTKNQTWDTAAGPHGGVWIRYTRA